VQQDWKRWIQRRKQQQWSSPLLQRHCLFPMQVCPIHSIPELELLLIVYTFSKSRHIIMQGFLYPLAFLIASLAIIHL
jgi:hypothetical protein